MVTAEEDGDGKIILLERGGYEGMDACVMYVRATKLSQLMHRLTFLSCVYVGLIPDRVQ